MGKGKLTKQQKENIVNKAFSHRFNEEDKGLTIDQKDSFVVVDQLLKGEGLSYQNKIIAAATGLTTAIPFAIIISSTVFK